MKKSDWWKNCSVYEIYIRSFQDSDGDGIGDLKGIQERLDYLKDLGVDVLWLTPFLQSPGEDAGYDISDYRQIMETFGTMEDFEQLLEQAHARGLRVIMDLVVNHTSSAHEWFQKSREGTDSPYRDYYIWRDGKEDGSEPNNWTSCFSGSAWKKDDASGQYYLHLFSEGQPDLNWDNPQVRQEVYDMMRFWLEKGIDGFRMDVISLISKDPKKLLEDSDIRGHTVSANGPHAHEYLQEMNREVLSRYDVMIVGETPAVTVEEARRYASEDGSELSMVFQFELMDLDGGESGKWNEQKFDPRQFRKVMGKWQKGLHGQAWNSIFLGNHDQPRAVSRFGSVKNEEEWKRSAKMLAGASFLLQGTPYIYQGEELGMTNAGFTRLDQYRDIESLRAYDEMVTQEHACTPQQMMRYLNKASRDNARTPMQWDSTDHAGFTKGTPWIEVNANYPEINAEKEEADPDSILNFYRQLLRFRKDHETVLYGDYEDLLPDDPSLWIYRRSYNEKELVVLANFSDQPRQVDPELLTGRTVLTNLNAPSDGQLAAYELRVLEA